MKKQISKFKKNGGFIKLVFLFGAAFFMFSYLKMRIPGSGDIRTNVQAVHSCTANTAYTCSGSCDAGYTCNNIDYYTCYCAKKAPTSTPVPANACTGQYKCVTVESTCDPAGTYSQYVCPGVQKCVIASANCVAPTAVACDQDGNGTCTGGSFCLRTGCDSCSAYDSNPNGYKEVYCWTSESCKNSGAISCSGPSYYKDNINCPASCGGAAVTPVPTGCQPYTCKAICGLGGCPGGCGNIDNCGGIDCASCGTKVAATSTPGPKLPTPVNCPDCSAQSCRDNICSDQTCLGTCDEYCYGALNCQLPVLDELIIQNADYLTVNKDANSRNHICESTFTSSSVPRRVNFIANMSDGNGGDDIKTVVMGWNGTSFPMTYDSVLGNDAVWKLTVDFTAIHNAGGTYPVYIYITDGNNRNNLITDSGRTLKVWDCQVPVSGNIYDGSAGQACNSTGFSNLVDSSFNFTTLLFRNATAGLGVSATVTQPNHFSGDLVWGNTYLPIFNGGSVANPNGDLWGSGRMTRIVDLGAGTTSCPVTDEFTVSSNVSAYSTNVSAAIDFSYIRTQEGWFQVAGAGVKARNQLSSGVPITAPAASRALSISKILADNGLVSFSSYSNINGLSDNSAYGLTNNWWVSRNTNDSIAYNYQYFYNNLFVSRDLGTTGSDWAGKPSEGVYFVNGNLNIDSDFALAAGRTMLVVVRGSITIADTVNRVDGIYIADGGITATGTSATQLVINGLLYSRGNIRIARSYTTALDNNSAPAVKINYQPNLIFNLPGTVMRVLSGWRQE